MKQLNPPHDHDFEESESTVDAFTLEKALEAEYWMPLYVKRAEMSLVSAKQTLTKAEAIYEKYKNEAFIKADARTANEKKAIAELALMNDQFTWDEEGEVKSCSYHELVELAKMEYSIALVHLHYQQNRKEEIMMRVSALKEQMKRI